MRGDGDEEVLAVCHLPLVPLLCTHHHPSIHPPDQIQFIPPGIVPGPTLGASYTPPLAFFLIPLTARYYQGTDAPARPGVFQGPGAKVCRGAQIRTSSLGSSAASLHPGRRQSAINKATTRLCVASNAAFCLLPHPQRTASCPSDVVERPEIDVPVRYM